MLKIRLHLLSKDTVRKLLDVSTFFNKDFDCVKILNEILHCEDVSFVNTSNVYQYSRYCNQKSFKILVCGGDQLYLPFSCNSVSCIDLEKTRRCRSLSTDENGA